MKISVFGMGYVGCVTAACLAKLGHEIIGVDVIQRKVESINKGEAPLKEKKLDNLIRQAVIKGRLKATTETQFAIENSCISFVCVGTPSAKDGSVELSFLNRALMEISRAIIGKASKHVIVIRSTIPPGTFQKILELLEKTSGKKAGKDFELFLSPEFMREGSAVDDFFSPPFIIIGANDKASTAVLKDAYKGISAKSFFVKPEIAETIKYANNSFHALKIAFANEIGILCKKLGIDGKKVMGLFCEDKQLNISPYYLMPGFAYGGSCLPKELAALQNRARQLSINLPLLNFISLSNYEHIKRAVKLIKESKKNKIGILGISFKKDTDDIRGNPILLVINKLLQSNFSVKIYDPHIKKENLENIEKSYRKTVYDMISKKDLKKGVKKISHLFCTLDEILECDVMVISNRDPELIKIAKNLNAQQILIDLQGIINPKEIKAQYISLC